MTVGVAGVRRTMKELVDGTIRVQVDIDPQYRDAFLKLFPSIDMPVALAPLTPEFMREVAVEEAPHTKDTSGWRELGSLCQSAIKLCEDAKFQMFASQHGARPGDPEDGAAGYLRTYCGVESRKDIDSSPEARAKFADMMRLYREWLGE